MNKQKLVAVIIIQINYYCFYQLVKSLHAVLGQRYVTASSLLRRNENLYLLCTKHQYGNLKQSRPLSALLKSQAS